MSAIDEITTTLENADCEGTESPWWMVIDPRQMFRLDVHSVNSMITGPFFSREDAAEYLNRRRYAFSKHARVYCASGYWSNKYKNLCRELKK